MTSMRDTRIRLFMHMELLGCRDELDWLMRCHHYAVNNCSGEYQSSMRLPVPTNYGENVCKRGQMAAKGILPPTLGMIVQTHYPLPVQHQSPVSLPPDIPPSPPPLPSTEPESLGDDEIKSKESSLKARAVDDMMGKHSDMESKRTCSTLKLSLQRAGTGVEAPGQPRQRTAVDGYTDTDGSLEQGGAYLFKSLSRRNSTNQRYSSLVEKP